MELLQLRAREAPDALLFRFLEQGECTGELSRGALERKARRVGARLQREFAPGERIILVHPPGLAFIEAFFGCLFGGMVPVPTYPPMPFPRGLSRLEHVLEDSGAAGVLTTAFMLSLFESLFPQSPLLARPRWIATDVLEEGWEQAWRAPPIEGRTLAMLQYTSGSTGEPRGVMVSHHHLLRSVERIQEFLALEPEYHLVSWLPLYHDMGLYSIQATLLCGASGTLMSPLDFLCSPLLWLEAISREKDVMSVGPNFSYELCIRKILPEERERLDLSGWRLAVNGAEPIRAETLERFTQTFAPQGFRREAFFPCYGLAEASLIVSGGPPGTPPVLLPVRRGAPHQRRVERAASGEAGTRLLVSCGRVHASPQVRIVDPDTRVECSPGQEGEIWLSGDSLGEGYWGNPEATARTFQARLAPGGEGPFLRTGDLGLLQDGVLFIAGRLKDLIIIAGRNHHPHDIEHTVERSHPALKPGGVAAFSVEVDGEEQLVLLAEIRRSLLSAMPQPPPELLRAIHRVVAEEHGLHPLEVVLLEPGALPKTSSGKLRRFACKAGYLDGTLPRAWVPPPSTGPGGPSPYHAMP